MHEDIGGKRHLLSSASQRLNPLGHEVWSAVRREAIDFILLVPAWVRILLGVTFDKNWDRPQSAQKPFIRLVGFLFLDPLMNAEC